MRTGWRETNQRRLDRLKVDPPTRPGRIVAERLRSLRRWRIIRSRAVTLGAGSTNIKSHIAISPVVVGEDGYVADATSEVSESGIVRRGAFGNVDVAGDGVVRQLFRRRD